MSKTSLVRQCSTKLVCLSSQDVILYVTGWLCCMQKKRCLLGFYCVLAVFCPCCPWRLSVVPVCRYLKAGFPFVI